MNSLRLFAISAMGLCLLGSQAFGQDGPPNFRAVATGVTVPAGDGSGLDLDTFAGVSTHLGKYTGEGAQMLFPDFTFAGAATYTAANGDQIDVIYTGHVVSFTEFPFPVVADFEVVGGSGRLADAEGRFHANGTFTGVPGDLYFELEGTLHPQGK